MTECEFVQFTNQFMRDSHTDFNIQNVCWVVRNQALEACRQEKPHHADYPLLSEYVKALEKWIDKWFGEST
jgi:hypothetical protein